MLAVTYIRMSSTKQEDSPENQRLRLRALAAKHGAEIVREYVDEGAPGDLERPELDRLIADAKRSGRKWSMILVDHQDRLSRELPILTLLNTLGPLYQAGVEIQSLTGPI